MLEIAFALLAFSNLVGMLTQFIRARRAEADGNLELRNMHYSIAALSALAFGATLPIATGIVQ